MSNPGDQEQPELARGSGSPGFVGVSTEGAPGREQRLPEEDGPGPMVPPPPIKGEASSSDGSWIRASPQSKGSRNPDPTPT